MEVNLTATNLILGGMLLLQVMMLGGMIYALILLARVSGVMCELTQTMDSLGARVMNLIDQKVDPALDEIQRRAEESEKIVENLGRLSESIERVGQAVAEKDDDIKAIIGNCRQVTEGVTEATRGVRDTVIPAVDQVSRLVRAFRRGVEVFGSAREQERRDLND